MRRATARRSGRGDAGEDRGSRGGASEERPVGRRDPRGGRASAAHLPTGHAGEEAPEERAAGEEASGGESRR